MRNRKPWPGSLPSFNRRRVVAGARLDYSHGNVIVPDTAVLPENATPSAIVKYLNQYVIGQEEAKRVLAVAVYAHYRKLTAAGETVRLDKSNVLIIGPTGTGKTLLCETLSRFLQVPFLTTDATSLAPTTYVGEEIEAILLRLLEKAGGDTERAGRGIVFIDEIDKLKARPGEAARVQATSGESVQHALLKIMEGYPVRLPDNRSIDTSGILFICGGAFVGLEQIMEKSHSFGYIGTGEDDNQNILDRLNSRVKPTDLFEFGLIPEFTGRLPVVARFQDLSKAMLVRVMTEPKNSLYNQFRLLLQSEGVELQIEPAVFQQIAEIAFEYKTGARSLRGIFEELLTPVLYAVPDHKEVKKVVIKSLFEDPSYYK